MSSIKVKPNDTKEIMMRSGTLNEKRAADDVEEPMSIEGYAVVFDEPTDLGYIEVIDSGALDNCDMSDTCLKYNHEDGYPVMARVRNNSLRLEIDEHGLKVNADLIDMQSNVDIYKAIRSGLLDKMSFAFIVSDAYWDTIDGVDVRHITGISKLFDVSVVDIPAYDQTEVYARGREGVEKEREEYHKLKLEKDKLKLKLSI